MEERAVAGVVIAFGRRAVGEQHIVVGELDMVVLDRARPLVPHDREVVDEVLDRDQRIVHVERMAVRHIEVAARHIVGERTPAHDDRPRQAVPPGDKIAPAADPQDWLYCARQRHDPVANRELFDRDLAALGQDHCAAAKADRRAEKDIAAVAVTVQKPERH